MQLPNKLDVILVSDPETQIAAAAVSVSAGQLQDPAEVQVCALVHLIAFGVHGHCIFHRKADSY